MHYGLFEYLLFGHLAEEGNSWDVVSENDLWDGENTELNEDEYVLVRQEDILEGIACFMTAYLESIKQTKVFCLCVSIFVAAFYFDMA